MKLKKLFIIFFLVLLCSVFLLAQTYIKGPALIEGTVSTATAAGTTTLTKDSQTNQVFTGSTTQTVVLPNATTLPVGRRFYITNRSTGLVTVQFNDLTTARSIIADTQIAFVLRDNSTSNGTWDISRIKIDLSDAASLTGLLDVSYLTGTLPVSNGGTGRSSLTSNSLLVGNGTSQVSLLGPGSQYQALVVDALGAPTLGQISLDQSAAVTGILGVSNGGTGVNSFTLGSIPFMGASTLTQDNANLFFDNTNDRLGIRVNTPQGSIHVLDNPASLTNPSVLLDAYGAVTPYIVTRRAQGTLASPTGVIVGNDLMTIGSRGYHSGGAFHTTDGAQIRFTASEVQSSTAQGTNIRFLTAINGTNALVEQWSFTSDGRTGFGTTSPNARLELNATSGTPFISRLQNNSNPSNIIIDRTRASNANLALNDPIGNLQFRGRANAASTVMSQVNATYLGDGTTNLSDLRFLTHNGTASTEAMRIGSNQFVGILTAAAPTSGLDVNSTFGVRENTIATSGNITALAPTTSTVRLTGTGVTVQGISSTSLNNRIYFLMNVTGSDLILANENASATAANRIITPTGADFIVPNGSGAIVQYDNTTARWRVVSDGRGGVCKSGSRASPNSIVAGTGITTALCPDNMVFVQGSAGNVTITANPAVTGCSSTTIGNMARIFGRNDSQLLTIPNQTGAVELNGDATLGAGDVLTLMCDGTAWVEQSRSF